MVPLQSAGAENRVRTMGRFGRHCLVVLLIIDWNQDELCITIALLFQHNSFLDSACCGRAEPVFELF